jgi:CBS-domain-containing membrane protein
MFPRGSSGLHIIMMNSETDSRQPLSGLEIATAYVRAHGLPSLVAGLGGMLAIWLLAHLSQTVEQALLIAPFGASCVLLFALPHSPLAQPKNVIGGHLLSASVGLLVLMLIGPGALACGMGVGMAIAVMRFTGTLHPPAGATPLVVIMTGANWAFLGFPVLAGTIALVLLAWLYHRLVSGHAYPA